MDRDWCLPVLLKEVKEILPTLVPSQDRVYLDEGFNVELIMQQFYKGTVDLEKLASWLSSVLKTYCAPGRDMLVDEMYNKLANGNRRKDMRDLVQGLRNLLNVLEGMKLDLANHSIRCWKSALIEDTVNVERRFFYKKIQSGRLDPHPANQWYVTATRDIGLSPGSASAFGDMTIFFEALSRLILPSSSQQLPNTFAFDEKQITKLRSDLINGIYLEICMRLSSKLESMYRNPRGASTLIPTSVPAPTLNTSSPVTPGSIYARSHGQATGFASITSSSGSLSVAAPETIKSPCRSSNHMLRQDKLYAQDTERSHYNLYNALTNLLPTAPASAGSASERKLMRESFAVEIFRSTNAPTEALHQVEEELGQHLYQPNSQLFQDVESHFWILLIAELQERVGMLKPLGSLGLFSAAVGLRNHGRWGGPSAHPMSSNAIGISTQEPREKRGIEDIAARLAHLGLIHWRVWSPLIYLGGYNGMELSHALGI
ncbi:hypothetical protein PG985_005716 [Apiospora marii]|uniref:uncharacterized protein n=1 Tax=Apiospora marii TaxID=335849 RepID=UPI00312F31A4